MRATRRCYACREHRPEVEMVPDKHKASGFASICRPCDRLKSRAYYEANREKELAEDARRSAAGLKGDATSRRARRAANPEAYAQGLRRTIARELAEQAATAARSVRNGTPWTPEEESLVLSAPVRDVELAIQLGRTLFAVRSRRKILNSQIRHSAPN